MRIGIIVPEFPTYSETFFVSQVKGLCERGHYVFLFRSSKKTDEKLIKVYRLDTCQNLQIVNIDPKVSAARVQNIFIQDPRSILKKGSFDYSSLKRKLLHNIFKSYFDKHICDVYHFGYTGVAIFYSALFPSLKGKIMISCLGTAEKVKPLTDPERISKLDYVLNASHSIHCVSQDMATTIKSYGAPPKKIYINRPGVDYSFFNRKSSYPRSSHIHILSVGRLVFQKGFIIGMLAIKKLKNNFSNFTWTITGDGPDMDELVFQIQAQGLQDHVVLTGKKTRDEVCNLYDDTDIFFLPSVSEGIANAVLEAMSMQLPIVSSVCGGMSEAIEHDVTGLLCLNYDYEGMAESLLKLCTNFEKRQSLGENARKSIIKNFSLKRMIDVYEGEYQKLLGV